jgi:hypothetical protein
MGPHGPGGCLPAPACGDLCPGPGFGCSLRFRHAGSIETAQEQISQPAAWQVSQHRSDRTGPPGLGPSKQRDQPSRRRSPATLGVGTDVPSQAGDAASMLASRVAGICLRRLPSSMVNRARAARGIFPRQGRGKFRRLEISASIGPVPTRVRHELVNGGAVLPAEIGPTVR